LIALEPGPVVPEPAVVKTMLLGGAGIAWLPDFRALQAARRPNSQNPQKEVR
jgi:hypothetical protein